MIVLRLNERGVVILRGDVFLELDFLDGVLLEDEDFKEPNKDIALRYEDKLLGLERALTNDPDDDEGIKLILR